MQPSNHQVYSFYFKGDTLEFHAQTQHSGNHFIHRSTTEGAVQERFPFEWKNRSFSWDNKWNSPSHWKIFGKKGTTSDVRSISHFYWNDRNITEPFISSHSRTMLLGERRGLFPKITSGENHSIWFQNGTTVFFHFALFHLAENCHRFFHINEKRSNNIFYLNNHILGFLWSSNS